MGRENSSQNDSINEKLSIRRHVFQSFAESSSFGIGLISEGGKVLCFNRKFRELLNTTDFEGISGLKDLLKRIEPEFIYKNEQFVNWFTSLETKSSEELRYENFIIEDSNGTKKHLNFLILPLENRVDLIIFEDVTSRIKIEELMSRLEGNLYHSKKLETIGLLTGGIIHDFSDILSVILGNAEIGLLRLHRSNPIYEILSHIKEAAQEGSELIKRLLGFVKLLRMKPKVLDLRELINNISEIPINLIGEDIELKIKTVEDLNQIYGDPGTIIQIFVTLLANAHLIIPSGGTLFIEAINRKLDEDFCKRNPFIIPGDYIQVSIIYSGEKINKFSIDSLSGRALQREDEMNLGSIYQLVKRSNGYILYSKGLENEQRVDIFFPVYKDILKYEFIDHSKETVSLQPKKILLAEDEEELRKVLYHFLSEIGYEIFEASNGEEAIRIFLNRQKDIDLIILDLMMPEMNGIDVYRNIRFYNSNIPCVVITGYNEELVGKYVEKDKRIVFIRKPFNLKDLEKIIQSTIHPS